MSQKAHLTPQRGLGGGRGMPAPSSRVSCGATQRAAPSPHIAVGTLLRAKLRALAPIRVAWLGAAKLGALEFTSVLCTARH
eukprot:1030968-Pleurochrysis_carterae.AAC.1